MGSMFAKSTKKKRTPPIKFISETTIIAQQIQLGASSGGYPAFPNKLKLGKIQMLFRTLSLITLVLVFNFRANDCWTGHD